jgi:hypothetical protein
MRPLDAAALHPDLQPACTTRHYFAEAARLRQVLTGGLVRDLHAEAYAPYLLHNTTSALMTVGFAAARAGRSITLAGPAEQHYPAYTELLPAGGPDADWEFRTHVSPLTGAVDALAGNRMLIVDAAQSVGTLLTSAALRAGDVVIAPMHKHLGLAVGLGLALVRNGRGDLTPVHEVFSVAESGAQSLELLRAAHQSQTQANGRVFNVAEVIADDRLDGWCAQRHLRLLAKGRGVPFACLTTTDGSPVTERLRPASWRHFPARNVARFSFHRRGTANDPAVDCTPAFRSAVTACLRTELPDTGRDAISRSGRPSFASAIPE